ncbi:MAG: radical SAM protein [Bacteroidota bacterium]|nr:radical SAM protein [Bacteroidota bacterium]
MNKVLLFNPRSANNKFRIPNSILQVAASIDGLFEWIIVDGNRETDPYEKIETYLKQADVKYVGFTVMPGPQLKQAIPFAKKIKEDFPNIQQIWGGYFASNQYKAVLESGYVDYVINGPGDTAFPALLKALEENSPIEGISNLIFKKDGKIFKTKKADLPDLNKTPALPYLKLDNFYSLDKYLGNTYLGTRTLAYHSSFGCPFTCSFCAVVPIYEARWKGKSAVLMYEDVMKIKERWGANAIEFHDNNFFVSEKRTVEFAQLIKKENMKWWGEARIDTMHKYKDESLQLIADAGCKMIFFGAETGNDDVLKKMDKGGTQTGKQILEFAARLKKFNIVPEYSFVLGTPADSPELVMKQIDEDIEFIKKVKEVNPDTEIIIYVYSPVPTEGSEMYDKVLASGFKFPVDLDDWLKGEWENFDLRKNPLTPWLTAEIVNKIKNFETVLNAYYPTVSDIRMKPIQRKVIRTLSKFRYKNNWYAFPYELKALQKYWIRYRQPEVQGF